MRGIPQLLGEPLGPAHIKEFLARITGGRRAGSELSASQLHQAHEDPALQKKLLEEVARCIHAREEIVPNLVQLLSPKSLETIHTTKELQTLLSIHIFTSIEQGTDVRCGYQECLSTETLKEIRAATVRRFMFDTNHPYLAFIPKRYAHFVSPSVRESIQTTTMHHLHHMIDASLDFPPIFLTTLTDNNFEILRKAVQEKKSKSSNPWSLPSFYTEVAALTLPARYEMVSCEEIFWNLRHNRPVSDADQQVITKLSRSGIEYLRKRSIAEVSTSIQNARVIPEPLLQLLSGTHTEIPQFMLIDYFKSCMDSLIHNGRVAKINDATTDQYLSLLTPQTRESLRGDSKLQEKAVAATRSQLKSGASLQSLFRQIAAYHPLHRDALSPEVLRSTLRDAIVLFFRFQEDISSRVDAFIEQLDDETVRKALLDKTMTPIGFKFHTVSNSPLTNAFAVTGGFVAHEQNTCFVSPVALNETMLGLCCALLNETVGQEIVPTPTSTFSFKQGYVQITMPHRLSNEYCSVGTVAYLLAHSLREVKSAVLKNNQTAARVTVYDAGTTVPGMHIPLKDGKDFPYKGRTDYMMAKTWSDIRNAHTIHTLLLHASDPALTFHELGRRFITDFENILSTHGALGWLGSNTFAHDMDSRKPTESENQEFAGILELINRRIALDSDFIREATKTIDTNQIRPRDIANPATYSLDPTEKKRRVDAAYASMSKLLTVQVQQLIDEYRGRLYPEGVYINELDSHD